MSYNPYAGQPNQGGGVVSAPPPRYSNNEGYVHEGAGGGSDFGRLGGGSVDQGHGGYYPPVAGASAGQSSLPPPTGSLSGDPGVGVAEKRFDYNTPYRDVFFAILFVIHLIFVFIIAGYYGPRVSLSVNSDNNTGGTGTPNDSKPFDGRRALGILIVSAIIGGVWSALWLEVMKKYANKIIMITLVLNGLLVFTAMIIAFATGAIGAGVGYLIIFAFACLYLYCVRHRIPFAHAVLHASALSLQKYSGPIYLTYFIAAISIGWFALWSYSFASLYMYGTEKGGKLTGGQQFLIVFLILSLYWTGQVLKNIGHTTTAGVVATFYFQPQIADATVPALKRSVTTSFGSICLGSLIVAAIRTVRVLLRSTRDRCADVVDCLLGMVERAVNYFNVYAYTMIAIYGYSFKESASQTMALFKARLFDALINDDLTGMVLLMGAFTAGAVAGIVAILWGAATKYDNWAGVAVLGFLVAFIIALLFMTVVESAVITTFVSWAMDPAVLSRNHPELYQNLESAAAAAGYQFKINTNAQAGPAIV